MKNLLKIAIFATILFFAGCSSKNEMISPCALNEVDIKLV